MIDLNSVQVLPKLLKRVGNLFSYWTPTAIAARAHNLRTRQSGLEVLARFSKTDVKPSYKKVLVDGQWDNPNYWLRYTLLRKALGLINAEEIGLTGIYNRQKVNAAFTTLGFSEVLDFGKYKTNLDRYISEAKILLENTATANDIHHWKLPHNFPSTLVYDGILKRQRRGDVDITDPRLPKFVAEALSALDLAHEVLDRDEPDLVVLSHMVDFGCGALAWAAVSRGIPSVVLYGGFGTNRFVRLRETDDIFAHPTRAMPEDEKDLTVEVLQKLAAAGRQAMEERIGGKTDDVSAIYAYRKRRGHVDKKQVVDQFSWDQNKPIIAVYASNWFDYPNGSGRFPYRDFREWAEVTIDIARNTPDVNWLFKAHPCDEWYGTINGPRLANLIDGKWAPNIALCDTSWNGRDIIDMVDGLITVHGAAGIEAAFLGTPVLLPYTGWYGHFSFAYNGLDRSTYEHTLGTQWWLQQDVAEASERACAFSGWYFSAPDWHQGWFMSEDACQEAIWWDLDEVLQIYKKPIAIEINEIRAWFEGDHRFYQIFKLRRAKGFVSAKPRPLNGGASEDPRSLQRLRKPAKISSIVSADAVE